MHCSIPNHIIHYQSSKSSPALCSICHPYPLSRSPYRIGILNRETNTLQTAGDISLSIIIHNLQGLEIDARAAIGAWGESFDLVKSITHPDASGWPSGAFSPFDCHSAKMLLGSLYDTKDAAGCRRMPPDAAIVADPSGTNWASCPRSIVEQAVLKYQAHEKEKDEEEKLAGETAKPEKKSRKKGVKLKPCEFLEIRPCLSRDSVDNPK